MAAPPAMPVAPAVDLRSEAAAAAGRGDWLSAARIWRDIGALTPDQAEPFLESYRLFRRVPDLTAAAEMLDAAFRVGRHSLELQQERVGLALDMLDLDRLKATWADLDPDTSKFDDSFFPLASRALFFQIEELDAFRADVIRRLCQQPVRDGERWVPALMNGICTVLYFHSYVRYLQVKADVSRLLQENPSWIDGMPLEKDFYIFFDMYQSEPVAIDKLIEFVISTPLSRVHPCFFALGNRNIGLYFYGEAKIEEGFRTSRFNATEKYRALIVTATVNKGLFAKIRSEQLGVTGPSDGASRYLRSVPRDPESIFDASLTRAKVNRRPAASRLRIALCVSGQLRGYKRAFSTWNHLGLDDHEVVPFIHVWASIGRKYPWPSHSHRLFNGAFLDAFNAASAELGFDAMQQRYKNFFQIFISSDRITLEELRNTYRTEYAIIEDDTAGEFAEWDNMRKMQYKMMQAHQLALSTGVDFDLFIRIRPDKTIVQADAFDWRDIHATSVEERVIFADFPFDLHPQIGFITADQFAVGCGSAMNVYASTYLATKYADQLGHPTTPSEFMPHRNYAYNALNNGVDIRTMPGIVFGEPVDAEQIPLEVIHKLLLADIGSRTPDRIDANLLGACDVSVGGAP